MAHNSVPSKLRTEVLSSSGKKFVLMFGLILFLSFSSAHDTLYKEKFSNTHYSSGNSEIISKTTWTYYDDDERYSTYDYRHGYSYRASRDYYDRKVVVERAVPVRRTIKTVVSYGRTRDYHRYDYRDRVDYYEEYVPHLRRYERRDCYVYPPADRLFYVAC